MIDHLCSVEQMWGCLRSIPDPNDLPESDIFFVRGDAKPMFESFPNGCRLTISPAQITGAKLIEAMEELVMMVMGEQLLQFGDDCVGGIRVCRRKKNLRWELWIVDQNLPKKEELKEYIVQRFKEEGIAPFDIQLKAFDQF